MLVVHGLWADGAACLWAEDSGLPVSAPPRPGRPSRAPRLHPFAMDAAAVAQALAELPEPAGDLARKAVDDELTLWLPSVADGPLASPELIRPSRAAGPENGAGTDSPAGAVTQTRTEAVADAEAGAVARSPAGAVAQTRTGA